MSHEWRWTEGLKCDGGDDCREMDFWAENMPDDRPPKKFPKPLPGKEGNGEEKEKKDKKNKKDKKDKKDKEDGPRRRLLGRKKHQKEEEEPHRGGCPMHAAKDCGAVKFGAEETSGLMVNDRCCRKQCYVCDMRDF